MGGGYWDDKAYRKVAKGTKAFAYSKSTLSKPRDQQRINQLLDPFGMKVRESRDSKDHPKSNAVIVGLDVTGSMSRVVVGIQEALGNLMDLLLSGKLISDPQLLFCAVGDAYTDDFPLQVSQFESDLRINDQLTKVVLEGGGGGQKKESYELAYYFAARHTAIDCWEKRKRKGYLFTIGDEMPYPDVDRGQVKKIFDANLAEEFKFRAAVKETQKRFNAFHIIPEGSSHYGDSEVVNAWVEALGGKEFVLILRDPSLVCEVVALAIGLNEGRVTFENGLKAVSDKVNQEAADTVRETLSAFAETVKDKKVQPVTDVPAPASAASKPKPKKRGRL